MPRVLGQDISCGYYSGGASTATQANAPDLTEYCVERFEYDPVGNLLALVYSGSQAWTREYGLDGCSREDWTQAQTNRLTSLKVGPESMLYEYDANGNMVQENENKHLEWDYADRMVGFADQAGSQTSVEVRYAYDAAGQRVKKWAKESGSGNAESTTYIDNIYEAHAWVENQKTCENTYLHVMDNQQRVAMVRSGNTHPKEVSPGVQYVLGDHLGSSQLVTDDTGVWINREEFTAFGETSFGSFSKKRYRYTGKERDEESGYYYHGARYYAPWVCRWTNTDPAGMVDGVNGYGYVRNNPMKHIDRDGRATSQNPNATDDPDQTANRLKANTKVDVTEKRDAAGTLKSIDVKLKNATANYEPYNGSCLAAAEGFVQKYTPEPLYKVAGSDTPGLVLYKPLADPRAQDAVKLDLKKVTEGLRYIWKTIGLEGLPVVAGVNVVNVSDAGVRAAQISPRVNDGVVEHFLVLTGFRVEFKTMSSGGTPIPLITMVYASDNAPGNVNALRDVAFKVNYGPDLMIVKPSVPNTQRAVVNALLPPMPNYHPDMYNEYQLDIVKIYNKDRATAAGDYPKSFDRGKNVFGN